MELVNHSNADNFLLQASQDQKEIIALMKSQNEILENIDKNLAFSLEQNKGNLLTMRTHVIDVDMSIGAMISFMFKWLIASIPFGIIIGIIYVVIAGLLYTAIR